MEDYEKKYKDALERAKKALQYNGALVTSIFPELGEEKEVGDEKTLDRIYNFILLSKDATLLPGVDADRMLSWLEKKKHEQNSVSKIPVSEKLYDSIKNVCACIDDVMSSEALVDITDYIEQANKNAQEAFDMIEKQNSLWNENDEKNVKNILYILNQLKGTSKYKEDKIAENCIDWIESVKNRFIAG